MTKFLSSTGIFLLLVAPAFGQNNEQQIPCFFNAYWVLVETVTPEYIAQAVPDTIPDLVIELDLADTLIKISPLVETEWNTRYDGRSQNVSCTNGLFSMLAFKGIIHTGIGLSSRWNLVWDYNDGDTHGLISNSENESGVEGLPPYTPRAPFFYTYFFRRVLGDVAVKS